MRGTKRIAVIVGAALTVTLLLTGSPAHATTAEGWFAGTGVITDDWGDEGLLSTSHNRVSHATKLWQLVLVADGAIEQDGTTYDLSDVDCDFGPNTAYATRRWQSAHGVGSDGIVGPQTLGRADNKLALTAWTGSPPSNVAYFGSRFTLRLIREADEIPWPKAYAIPGDSLTSSGGVIRGSNWTISEYFFAGSSC